VDATSLRNHEPDAEAIVTAEAASVYLVMIFLLTYPTQTRFVLGPRLDH